jgi:hypothetical protein
MQAAVERLQPLTMGSTLTLPAGRQRSLLRWRIVEGIDVFDNWTDVFEPVRRRPLWSPFPGQRWKEIQAVEDAAHHVGQFLRERPDLDHR